MIAIAAIGNNDPQDLLDAETSKAKPTLTNSTTRLQARLAFTSAAKRFWYILRGMDQKGSGCVKCPIEAVLSLCKRKLSTCYQWLRQAKAAGRIRNWYICNGVLTVYYASRSKVCKQERIRDWGVSADISLEDAAQNLRKICVELEAQSLQERSLYAAKKSLRRTQRRYLKVYRSDELLECAGVGATAKQSPSYNAYAPGIVHYNDSKIFVGTRFVPFGGSQKTTAAALGCSIRTVQRHLSDIPRRQLIQTDKVYSLAAALVEHEGSFARSAAGEVHACPDGRLFINSSSSGARSRSEFCESVRPQQLFKSGGRSWRFRCNVYLLDRRLTSAKYARKRLAKLMVKPALEATRGGVVQDKQCLLFGENSGVISEQRQAE